MPPIDISNLPRNEATRPFHLAAGIEVFEGDPYELTDNECLAYQIHEERPDTYIRAESEAASFLSRLEPDKARAIQKRGENMCGIAELLVGGTDEIFLQTFQALYSENPEVTKEELVLRANIQREADLRRKEMDEFQARMRKVNFEVLYKKARGVSGIAMMALGVALGTALLVTGAPIAAVFFVGGGTVLLGSGAMGTDFLKEIHLPFFS